MCHSGSLNATTKRRLKNQASVRYTLEVKQKDLPKQYQPYGWLESGCWSISSDGLVGLAARDFDAAARRPGCRGSADGRQGSKLQADAAECHT